LFALFDKNTFEEEEKEEEEEEEEEKEEERAFEFEIEENTFKVFTPKPSPPICLV
jgi:hypothetical protein